MPISANKPRQAFSPSSRKLNSRATHVAYDDRPGTPNSYPRTCGQTPIAYYTSPSRPCRELIRCPLSMCSESRIFPALRPSSAVALPRPIYGRPFPPQLLLCSKSSLTCTQDPLFYHHSTSLYFTHNPSTLLLHNHKGCN